MSGIRSWIDFGRSCANFPPKFQKKTKLLQPLPLKICGKFSKIAVKVSKNTKKNSTLVELKSSLIKAILLIFSLVLSTIKNVIRF